MTPFGMKDTGKVGEEPDAESLATARTWSECQFDLDDECGVVGEGSFSAPRFLSLYVVGLDNHVDFLIVRSGEVLFHHSSYVGSTAVVREKAVESPPLAQSRYRVIGKLFTEDALVEAWIRGTLVPTKVRGGG